jgi:hypothetical protein
VRYFKLNYLDRTTEILTITSLDQIPSPDKIQILPREKTLKLVFEDAVLRQREAIGQSLKKELSDFQVSIHTISPEINIAKLITEKEVQDNQLFFESCAQDYRELGQYLIFKLADKLGIEIDKDIPMSSFNPFKRNKRQIGTIDGWRYYLHGIHCGFKHKVTKQTIEVCLVFGLEFGDLDPYFFSGFIKSTPQYKPLPVQIYEDYADGVRIIEQMISLGRFERIHSKESHTGVVVTNRDKTNAQQGIAKSGA